MKIELDPNRSKLSEGRTRGIGYAFLKKESEGFFKGVQPISTCKDYLNDFVWAENTGGKVTVYGINAENKGIFDTHGHLAISVLKGGGGTYEHTNFKLEHKCLMENLGKIEKLMNIVEEKLKITGFTKLAKVDDNLVYAQIPLEWVKSTWLISLWSFMFRNFLYAESEDPIEALKKTKDDTGDAMSVPKIIKGLEKFFKDGLPKQAMSKDQGMYTVHNNGILTHLG